MVSEYCDWVKCTLVDAGRYSVQGRGGGGGLPGLVGMVSEYCDWVRCTLVDA